MRRLAVAALLCALAFAAPASARQSAQAVSSFARLYSSYASGDYAVIQRSIRTRDDFMNVRSDVFSAVGRWKGDWQRLHVSFLLDLSMLALSHAWYSPVDSLSAGRDLLRGRPTRVGANAEDDRFEAMYHKAAVALLLAASYPDAADAYLDSLRDRVVAESTPLTKEKLVEPRLTLQRAMAAEIRTRPILAISGSATRRLESTLTLYDAAARYPANAAEARTRRAYALLRLNRPADAIQALERVPVETADGDVVYWGALVRGRAEDALGHQDKAIEAYRAALAGQPGAQSATAALSVLLLRANKPDEARQLASMAMSAPLSSIDPWWRYWAADRRMITVWMNDLRRMSQ